MSTVNVNPKDFDAAGTVTDNDLLPLYQPAEDLAAPAAAPDSDPTRWRVLSISSLLTKLAGLFAPASHTSLTTAAHGGVVASTDSRLSDARAPLAHTQDISSINGLATALNQKEDAGTAADLLAALRIEADPFNQYLLKAAVSPAFIITPAKGSALDGASQVFNWDNAGATAYQLWVGTSVGGREIGDFPSAPALVTNVTVTGLPTDGGTIYVRLYSQVAGSWQFNDYTFTAAGTPTLAVMIVPVNGTTLLGADNVFMWTDSHATSYQLWAGTSIGGREIGTFPTEPTVYTSISVTGLPIDDSTVYVRLYSLVSGTWLFRDYVYISSLLLPPAFTWPPSDGPDDPRIWVARNGAWEVLEIGK